MILSLGRWTHDSLEKDISRASKIHDVGDRIRFISSLFLETPYKEGTLKGDIYEDEVLTIYFDAVDCFTLLDYIEALRLSCSLDEFKTRLIEVRYRYGIVRFTERNHFFTDWIEYNNRFVRDVTEEVGMGRTERIRKNLNMRADGSFFVKGVEVKQRDICYIPSACIDDRIEDNLNTGDYAGIYTDEPGLDVSHVGIIIREADKTFLRHASSLEINRKVIDQDFREYMTKKEGLIVLRPKDTFSVLGCH